MNKIEEIKRRINRVIDIEIGITTRERDEFEAKRSDNEYVYGLGGPYDRYTKCIEARENHLEELEALRNQAGAGLQITEPLKLWPWHCPSCQLMIYLDDRRCRYGGTSEIIDCPICQRTLYRAANYTTWDTIKGSRRSEVHDR